MLTGLARGLKSLKTSRAAFGLGLTSLSLLVGAGAVHDATALNETRTLSFHHTHSGEDLTVTFKRNGRYDEAALKQLNHHLRDWRNHDQTTMDRRLFDILWEVYRDVDGKQPIHIISAYRSPATNAMLRRRSSGVARHSQHMLGHAMDFFIPGVALEKIRIAGLRQQRGGVGFYPTSGSPFVHLDTGSVRHWPRMSADQLASVFPNGRTVHLPSNGQPLRGYELALADIEKRGDGDSASSSKPSLFTSLFKGRSADDEDEGAPVQAVPSKPNPSSVMASAAPMPATDAAPVPMPRSKPMALASSAIKPANARVQLASADEVTLPVAVSASAQFTPPRPPMPVGPSSSSAKAQTGPQTPADIINARGFWDDMTPPKQATPAQVAAITARQALAGADTTGSIDSSFQALSYAPPTDRDQINRPQIVAAAAPIPRDVRPVSVARNPMAVNAVTTVVSKGLRAPGVATATRLAAAANRDNDVWMRAMVLTRSASAMHATVMGEPDLTLMRAHFAKPAAVVAMSFGNDPLLGISTEGFSGPAVTRLATQAFVTRTASLR